MLTEYEQQIKVIMISYEEGEEILVENRLNRLHHFAEHLGFLVGALLNSDEKYICLFVAPHTCPCMHIPIKEKITLVDTIAIENFCRDNGLVVNEIISLEEHVKRETKKELDSIETEINELN